MCAAPVLRPTPALQPVAPAVPPVFRSPCAAASVLQPVRCALRVARGACVRCRRPCVAACGAACAMRQESLAGWISPCCRPRAALGRGCGLPRVRFRPSSCRGRRWIPGPPAPSPVATPAPWPRPAATRAPPAAQTTVPVGRHYAARAESGVSDGRTRHGTIPIPIPAAPAA